MTTADQLTFGVEIETVVGGRDRPDVPFSIGGYHSRNGIRLDADSPFAALNGWGAQYDGSIRIRNGGRACEFVSPVLQGADGLRNLFAAVKCIRHQIRASVNRSCGVHVHIGFPRNADALKRLVHLVATHESALFACSGTPRRENGNWCRGIKNDYSPEIRFSMGASGYYDDGLRCNQGAFNDRYKILNLSNMVNGRNTVEFRLFSGSTNEKKIMAWVRLCLSIVEKALGGKRAVKWNSNDKAVVNKGGKSGDGFKQVKLLMYKIGWVRGRSFQTVNGEKVHKTWGAALDKIDGLPTLKDDKRALKALARKYDEKIASGRY
jgi:hypothetical protein